MYENACVWHLFRDFESNGSSKINVFFLDFSKNGRRPKGKKTLEFDHLSKDRLCFLSKMRVFDETSVEKSKVQKRVFLKKWGRGLVKTRSFHAEGRSFRKKLGK